ncbi:uncharacterized protein LOC143035766 [Oratosquilla oratoria]|uniref:uncharacterized protein LOC143035766 n=1 Tax=Oratosquilla oratoria TaxID=337810 RepID=UPI003F775DD1
MMWFGSLFMVFLVPGIQSEVSHAFLHGNEGVPRQFLYLANQKGHGFPQVGDGSTQTQSGFPQILEGDRRFPQTNPEGFPQILEGDRRFPQTNPEGFPQILEGDRRFPQTNPEGFPQIIEGDRRFPQTNPEGFPQIIEGDRRFPQTNPEGFPQIIEGNRRVPQTNPERFPQILQDQGSPQTSPEVLQGLQRLIRIQGQLGSQDIEDGPNTQGTRFTTGQLNRDLGNNLLDLRVLTVTVTQTIYSLTTTTRISTVAIPSTTTAFLASTSTDFFKQLETTPANVKLATHERTTTVTQILSVTDTLGITTITTSFVPTITSVPVDETIVKTSIVYSTIVNTKIFSHTITTTTILDPTGPATEYTTATRTIFKPYQPYNSLPVYRRH